MVDAHHLRALALALPEVEEKPHHGFPSFRVRGKVFATVPDPDHAHLMLDEDGIRTAVVVDPTVCEEKWWGDKLAAVRVTLSAVAPDVLEMLVRDAWSNKAPPALRRALPGAAGS